MDRDGWGVVEVSSGAGPLQQFLTTPYCSLLLLLLEVFLLAVSRRCGWMRGSVW